MQNLDGKYGLTASNDVLPWRSGSLLANYLANNRLRIWGDLPQVTRDFLQRYDYVFPSPTKVQGYDTAIREIMKVAMSPVNFVETMYKDCNAGLFDLLVRKYIEYVNGLEPGNPGARRIDSEYSPTTDEQKKQIAIDMMYDYGLLKHKA